MADALNLAGRLLIALLFFGGAAQKVIDPEPVALMLASVNLPALAIWPVALFNLAGAVLLLAGPRVRQVALVLAAYCVLTSYFHWQLRADPWQVTIFIKNWAIAGGLMILAAQGPGRLVLFR